jgi:hypothetical protein
LFFMFARTFVVAVAGASRGLAADLFDTLIHLLRVSLGVSWRRRESRSRLPHDPQPRHPNRGPTPGDVECVRSRLTWWRAAGCSGRADPAATDKSLVEGRGRPRGQ